MGEVILIRTLIANNYLVTGERPYLVDTNAPKFRGAVLKAMANHGIRPQDLSYILITHYHFDHTGSLAYFKRASGAPVAAGKEDAPFIEGRIPQEGPSDLTRMGKILRKAPRGLLWYQKFEPAPVDLPLGEGDRVEELGLEVIALPGHTPGGVAFLDREKGRAFIGDMVSYYAGKVGYPMLMFSQNLEAIRESMRRLADLDLEYMFTGHGKVIGPGASNLVRDFLARR